MKQDAAMCNAHNDTNDLCFSCVADTFFF